MRESKKNIQTYNFNALKALKLSAFIFLFFGISLTPTYKDAHAAVKLSKNWPGIVTSHFPKWRGTRYHKGTDYRTPCGTSITVQKPVTCHDDPKGYGSYARVEHACGIVEIYAHLRRCVRGETHVISGGQPGEPGAGRTTACHLHHEVRITGCHVSSELSFQESDLCQESSRKKLLDHAKSEMRGQASCSAGGQGTQKDNPGGGGTSTPSGGLKSVSQVDTGTVNPVTGILNIGEPYVIIETEDGRIITRPVYRFDENENPILPPTETDVVPSTQTDNEITGCATDTWKAMVNQSVLQTRRELLYNNTIISKGDTVLTYSCFKESQEKVGKELGPIFSESKMWVNKTIDIIGKTVTVNRELGETSLDGAINTSAQSLYEAYAQSNFDHGFLGGKAGGIGDGPSEDQNEGEGSQANVPCGMMKQIWDLAKCRNVGDEPEFKKFEDLIQPDSDPRKYPQNMQCKNTGITQGMIDIARNKEAEFSKVKTHLDKLMPDGDCAPAIPTGVTVTRRRGAGIISQEFSYPDAVCVSPGCSYQNSGGGAGECRRN
jgi:murein DD-endopeptidase MepM/ murein hydrolase activator NlpD